MLSYNAGKSCQSAMADCFLMHFKEIKMLQWKKTAITATLLCAMTVFGGTAYAAQSTTTATDQTKGGKNDGNRKTGTDPGMGQDLCEER